MSLLSPYGLNSALRPRPMPGFEEFAKSREESRRNYAKLEKMAQQAEISPSERARIVGNLIQKGHLTNTADTFAKSVAARYAIERGPGAFDDPEKARLNKAVGRYMADAPGMSPISGQVFGGFGRAPRMVKAASDASFDAAVKPLGQDAMDGLNQLSSGLRQSVVAALTQPIGPDQYRWAEWITELRQRINDELTALGIDPSALLRSLNRKTDFFDPMTQDNPFSPPDGANVGAGPDDPLSWPTSVTPPVEPRPTGSFADNSTIFGDTINGSKFAKFATTSRGQPLRKFHDYGRATGSRLRKREDGSPEELESYAKVIVKSELPQALRHQVLQMHDARQRIGKAAWQAVKREPAYQGMVNAILNMETLTQPMKGACLTLIR